MALPPPNPELKAMPTKNAIDVFLNLNSVRIHLLPTMLILSFINPRPLKYSVRPVFDVVINPGGAVVGIPAVEFDVP
jgi:hypothetical protein